MEKAAESKEVVCDTEKKMYATDVVGEEMDDWFGETILLSMGTGRGKSTLIRNYAVKRVVENNLKVLYIVPRTILQEQIRSDFCKLEDKLAFDTVLENIDIITAQSLEEGLKMGSRYDDYGLVIFDEIHYVIEDARFNPNVDLSYQYLRDVARYHSQVILISATSEEIRKLLENDWGLRLYKEENKRVRWATRPYLYREYAIQNTYEEYDFRYLCDEEETFEIVKGATGRMLVFVSNKKRGLELCEKLKSVGKKCHFITADNKNGGETATSEKLVDMMMFDFDVLVATSVLDVGVNVVDAKIEGIVVDAKSKAQLVQMIGRVRRIEGQEICIYLYKHDLDYFYNYYKYSVKNKMQWLQEAAKVDKEYKSDWLLERLHDGDGMARIMALTYDGKMYLSKMAEYVAAMDYNLVRQIVDGMKGDENFYIKMQLSWLGQEDNFSVENFVNEEVKKRLVQEAYDKIIALIQSYPEWMKKDESMNFCHKVLRIIRNIDHSLYRSDDTLTLKKFNLACVNFGWNLKMEQATDKKTRRQIYKVTKIE